MHERNNVRSGLEDWHKPSSSGRSAPITPGQCKSVKIERRRPSRRAGGNHQKLGLDLADRSNTLRACKSIHALRIGKSTADLQQPRDRSEIRRVVDVSILHTYLGRSLGSERSLAAVPAEQSLYALTDNPQDMQWFRIIGIRLVSFTALAFPVSLVDCYLELPEVDPRCVGVLQSCKYST